MQTWGCPSSDMYYIKHNLFLTNYCHKSSCLPNLSRKHQSLAATTFRSFTNTLSAPNIQAVVTTYRDMSPLTAPFRGGRYSPLPSPVEGANESRDHRALLSSPAITLPDSPASQFSIPRKPLPASMSIHKSVTGTSASLQKNKKRLFWVWIWEIGACLLAIAALIATGAFLHTYRSRPLPQLPFDISVNALISIYMVTMKAALVTVVSTGLGQLKWTWFESGKSLNDLVAFDEASHSTLGSLYLIWYLRFRQFIASLGAVLTVVLLAVDPFTQQLIRYVGCSEVHLNETALIPCASVFPNIGWINNTYPKLLVEAISATNSGFFVSGIRIDITCSTRNCTFAQEYGSLGYCSSCKDLSHLIKFNSTCRNHMSDNNNRDPSSRVFCNTTSYIPNGISMTSNPISQFPVLAIMSKVFQSGDLIYSGLQILISKSDLNRFGVYPVTGDLLEGCDNSSTSDTWRYRNFGAAEYALSPCIRTYKAKMTAGVFHEEQIDQIPYELGWGLKWGYSDLMTNPAKNLDMIDLQCMDITSARSFLKQATLSETISIGCHIISHSILAH